MAPRMPSALFRSEPSLKSTETIEKTDGESTAPAAPCRSRATISISGDVESPARSENAANEARPIMKIMRRPSRSPMRPPRSRNPPNVSA